MSELLYFLRYGKLSQGQVTTYRLSSRYVLYVKLDKEV